MGDDLPNLRLELASRPENVAIVRGVLTGMAGVAGAADALPDIRTAVSEACNNVVRHAYAEPGPLEVDVSAPPGAFIVEVRDRGIGMAGGTPALGLSVIDALCQHTEYVERPGGGMTARMVFEIPTGGGLPAPQGDPLLAAVTAQGFDATVQLAITPAALAPPILGRLVCSLAARARFSIDRVADVQLLTDALAGHVASAVDGSYLGVGIGISQRRVELRIGPMQSGHARELVAASAVGGIGPIIERLAEVEVRESGHHEILALIMQD